MRVVHLVPGIGDVANGMVVVARLIAGEQGEACVVDLNQGMRIVRERDVEEVWVHGMWLPREWRMCRAALKAGKRLVRMTHGSLSPVYLERQGKWKKRFVGPMERLLLRRCEKIAATCEAEADWIRAYLGRQCPAVEVIDMRRFFSLNHEAHESREIGEKLHLLYLGRRHPLKGLEFLEKAVEDLESRQLELKFVSNAIGEEKEDAWQWCDVLVLPTLSENFGLVVAEALERGKRVITTDGAPAWGDGNDYGGRLTYLKGYRDGPPEERVRLLKDAVKRLLTFPWRFPNF